MVELKEIKERVELNELLAKIAEEAGPKNIGWAIGLAINELKELRKKSFWILFDSQMATLKERGAPEHAIESFCSRKMSVLRMAEQMDIGTNSVPFIPVISGPFTGSLEQLMNMVRSGGQKGHANFNFDRLSEVFYSDDLYFIFDVESSETCGNAIFGSNRHFLTTCEAIAFATHTEVLPLRTVIAEASLMTGGSGKGKMAPIIRISHDGYHPVLGATFDGTGEDLSELRMITSCKSRSECL